MDAARLGAEGADRRAAARRSRLHRRWRWSSPCARSRAGATSSTTQLTRIENPDRKARFEFVMPALSADAAERERWFQSLADVDNRRREPWVLEGLELPAPSAARATRRRSTSQAEPRSAVGDSEDRRHLLPDALDEHDAVGPQRRRESRRPCASFSRAAAQLSGATAQHHSAAADELFRLTEGPGHDDRAARSALAFAGLGASRRLAPSGGFGVTTGSVDTITIRAARVIDGRGAGRRPTRRSRSAARRSSASARRRAAATYDLGTLTLLPGFIDTHVHIGWHFGPDGRYVAGREPAEEAALYGAENAYVTLMAGFTTVQSVGAASDKPLRDAIARGVLPGPRILTSLGSIGNAKLTPDQIREEVRKRKAEGADLDQDLRLGEHPRRRHADAVAGTARRRVRRGDGAGPALDGARPQPRSDDAGRARRLHRRRARRAGHAGGLQAAGRTRRLVRSRTSAWSRRTTSRTRAAFSASATTPKKASPRWRRRSA